MLVLDLRYLKSVKRMVQLQYQAIVKFVKLETFSLAQTYKTSLINN